VCKIDFVFFAAAVDHFNAHSVAAMMGYRHFPPALPDELRNATVCPPTYLPNMTMLDHSPPPSPAVLLHMMSNHLAWLSDEVANLPVSSYDANQEARAGRLALADLPHGTQNWSTMLKTCISVLSLGLCALSISVGFSKPANTCQSN